MSNRSTFSSSQSISFSSSNNGRATTGQASMRETVTDADGNTTVKTSNQTLGQPAVEETRRYDSRGQTLAGNGDSGSRRIEDVSDEQAENDRLYEERMEDEYAKREGGA